MKLAPAFVTLCGLVASAFACPGEEDHHHEFHKREFPSTTLPVPSKPLVWGDVNIIHTTDSHGWLLGHQKTSFPEPNYRYALNADSMDFRADYDSGFSGDLGDFSSFVAHMKQTALVCVAFLRLKSLLNCFSRKKMLIFS